jgi:hypothetical protein
MTARVKQPCSLYHGPKKATCTAATQLGCSMQQFETPSLNISKAHVKGEARVCDH